MVGAVYFHRHVCILLAFSLCVRVLFNKLRALFLLDALQAYAQAQKSDSLIWLVLLLMSFNGINRAIKQISHQI